MGYFSIFYFAKKELGKVPKQFPEDGVLSEIPGTNPDAQTLDSAQWPGDFGSSVQSMARGFGVNDSPQKIKQKRRRVHMS